MKVINLGDESFIAIWKIEESINDLEILLNLPILRNKKYLNFTRENRKKEWLATRVLIQKTLKDKNLIISYNENGKPLLSNGYYISISHSKSFVAVILSKDKSVGIDIQVPKNNIEKGISIFMTPTESVEIGELNYHQKLHIYWCAKESLYKYIGDNTLDIYTHFKVKPFDISKDGIFYGIVNTTKEVVKMKYEILDAYYLVYILNT